MRYIHREIGIIEVARALDLKIDGPTKIHCWHPDRHKHADRTASVSIRTSNNTVKCFGCGSKPIGPIDLVMDVLDMSAADAALWIAARFPVPSVPRRRPVPKPHASYRVGYENGIGLLVRSGLWGTLSEAVRCIAPVLLEMAERVSPASEEFTLQMSYVAISRFSGVRSHRAVRKALGCMSALRFLYRKVLKRRDIAYGDLVFPKVGPEAAGRAEPRGSCQTEGGPSLRHRGPKRVFRRDEAVRLREEGMSWREIAAELGLPVVEECREPRSEGRRPYFSGTKLAWISSGASGTKIRCAYGL